MTTDKLLMTHLEHNLTNLKQRIANAAVKAGRHPNEITLIAVSKTFPAEAVLAAYALGIRHFGENRVEEATPKIRSVMRQLSADAQPPNQPTTELTHITWHLIGHLQSRKVKDAVALFDFIQSVDSVRLAIKLNERAAMVSKKLPILLEINVSGEASKNGLAPTPWESFLAAVNQIVALPSLDVQGLMTIPPIVQNPDEARPHFGALRELRDQLHEQIPSVALPHLSMGMTDDFEAAIAEGATIIRIGRAIFGERKFLGEIT